MVPCDKECRRWVDKHGQKLASLYYHCKHPTCFSRGPANESSQEHVSPSKSKARRHVTSHRKHEVKLKANLKVLWKQLLAHSSTAFAREVKAKHITPFRLSLPTKDVGAASAHSWRSRLLVGKVGEPARMLEQAIEGFGTVPASAVMPRCIHHPSTNVP